jgi:hypothetical protein
MYLSEATYLPADCCFSELAPNVQFFQLYQVAFNVNDDDVHFILDQHSYLDLN